MMGAYIGAATPEPHQIQFDGSVGTLLTATTRTGGTQLETPLEARIRPEIIFALVGPAGVRLDDLTRALNEALRSVGYESTEIRLSELLKGFTGWTTNSDSTEFGRIKHGQEMGNKFRSTLRDGAALARVAIAAIQKKRAELSHAKDTPAPARAYIIQQLKHPAEVELLRQVYGPSFFLIAGHAPKKARVKSLSERMAKLANQPGQADRFVSSAATIIESDEKQDDDFGQNTRDTYPLADFFANLGMPSGEHRVKRFVDLVFGHPFHTPSPEEYAMYQASAVSLRSSDHSRQVGAVIVRLTQDQNKRPTNADIIASGMNEVPRGGGGFYWDEDSPDQRDQALSRNGDDDSATQIKISALTELFDKIREQQWLNEQANKSQASDLARNLLPKLKRTQFMDIGEFMRPVHAEMAALLDGARRGVAVNEHTMYVTTFPCHNCAKHIIAAGLKKVVYLEPYPKSRANFLHGAEISLESPSGMEEEGKVVFSAFSGVAPTQYRQLFSMSERGAKKGMALAKWEAARLSLLPRYIPRNSFHSYLVEEHNELKRLPTNQYLHEELT